MREDSRLHPIRNPRPQRRLPKMSPRSPKRLSQRRSAARQMVWFMLPVPNGKSTESDIRIQELRPGLLVTAPTLAMSNAECRIWSENALNPVKSPFSAYLI